MANPAEARAQAANEGKDVTPRMADSNEKSVRVVWEDKGPVEKEFDFVEPEHNFTEIKRLSDKDALKRNDK